MKRLCRACFASFFFAGVALTSLQAVVITSDFADDYSIVTLGSITGVPINYGGLTIRPEEPDFLYIGGAANQNGAAVYRVPLTRDVDGFITGFGEAVKFADTPNIDGGLVFSPTGTMLFTRYNMNDIGQVAAGQPGTPGMTETQDLTALGIASSVGSLNFIPSGFAGAGDMLIVSYNGNTVYRVPFTEVGGVYTFQAPTHSVGISGGPEGITHVPLGSPVFGQTPHVLVSAYQANTIVAYEIDGNGLPIPATARNLVTGLTNAEGAAVDPVTGDFLFSSFGGGNQVYRVTGFIPEPSTYAAIFGVLALLSVVWVRRRAERR